MDLQLTALNLHLTRLKDMHPLLPWPTALDIAFKAAIGLGRNGHVTGGDLEIWLDDEGRDGVLHWDEARFEEGRQLDYKRVTEDAAEAIALALVSVAKGWKVYRRLQQGEYADFLLEDADNQFVALEISGVDRVDADTRRLKLKIEQIRRGDEDLHKFVCVIELGPPRSRFATA